MFFNSTCSEFLNYRVSFPGSSNLLPPKDWLYMKFFVTVVIHVIAESNAECDLPKKNYIEFNTVCSKNSEVVVLHYLLSDNC